MATTRGSPRDRRECLWGGTKPKKAVAATPNLYGRIRDILESARAGVARSVNTTQVMANWLIGREIVEEEQAGKRRPVYGAELRREANSDAARRKSVTSVAALEIRHAVRDESWRLAMLNYLVK